MPKHRVFIDSGVLIAAATGTNDVSQRAFEALDDPEADYVSSVYVQLETLPKSIHHKKTDEVEFYREFFGKVVVMIDASNDLVRNAMDEASQYGLGAVDALHVVAALSAGATELVTTEKKTKPIHRVKNLPVRSIAS